MNRTSSDPSHCFAAPRRPPEPTVFKASIWPNGVAPPTLRQLRCESVRSHGGRGRVSGRRERAVVVAVPGVRVMQLPGDEVVHVAAMTDGDVAAVDTVNVVVLRMRCVGHDALFFL